MTLEGKKREKIQTKGEKKHTSEQTLKAKGKNSETDSLRLSTCTDFAFFAASLGFLQPAAPSALAAAAARIR